MTTNHTVPPIAYGAIYEEETMGTREREEETTLISPENMPGSVLAAALRGAADEAEGRRAEILRVAAARLEGGDVEVIERREIGRMDDGTTTEEWTVLVRRREGGDDA